MNEVRKKIRLFILTSYLFTEDESKLADGASLLALGILDSTGVLELVAFLEREFGVTVADEEMVPDNLDSVDRICAFVEPRRKG